MTVPWTGLKHDIQGPVSDIKPWSHWHVGILPTLWCLDVIGEVQDMNKFLHVYNTRTLPCIRGHCKDRILPQWKCPGIESPAVSCNSQYFCKMSFSNGYIFFHYAVSSAYGYNIWNIAIVSVHPCLVDHSDQYMPMWRQNAWPFWYLLCMTCWWQLQTYVLIEHVRRWEGNAFSSKSFTLAGQHF